MLKSFFKNYYKKFLRDTQKIHREKLCVPLRFFAYLCVIFYFSFNAVAQKKYTTTSQKAIRNYENATQLYDASRREEAVRELVFALQADKNFIEAHMLMGDILSDLKRFDKAAEHYNSALKINPAFFPNTYFNLAEAEMLLEKYADAKSHLQTFFQTKGVNEKLKAAAQKMIINCDFAIDAMKHPVPFNPVNLGDKVNSEFREYLPTLTADEQTLIFTRLVPRRQDERIPGSDDQEEFFVSKKLNSEWNHAYSLGPPINTPLNEGAQCIAPDGRTIYYTGCDREKGFGSCDIYFSQRLGLRWTDPVNMGAGVNTEHWDSQPSISSDGNTIYFLSTRPGGLGRSDIWKITKQADGSWGNPENLGATINTPDEEQSPFIHPDNITLYFASRGHTGMGGYDMYVSRKDSAGKFSSPKNLGYPINTSGDENSLIVNTVGTTAYFASDRLKGLGGNDLYSFELYAAARPLTTSYVKGTITDGVIRKGVEASYEIIELKSGKTITKGTSDRLTGEFLICLPSGNDYALNVSKTGYLFYSDHFSCSDPRDMKNAYLVDVMLNPVRAGEKVVLKNIFYETDAYALKKESHAELEKLVSFMNANPKVTIEISGHTDSTGTKSANSVLSQNRAKAVYDFMLSKKIPAARMAFKGYGDSQPVTSNSTAGGRAMNRRTEFRVMKAE